MPTEQKPDQRKVLPSATGRERYPPDGLYDGEYPCTCRPECSDPCKGECGCEACRTRYSDFLSME